MQPTHCVVVVQHLLLRRRPRHRQRAPLPSRHGVEGTVSVATVCPRLRPMDRSMMVVAVVSTAEGAACVVAPHVPLLPHVPMIKGGAEAVEEASPAPLRRRPALSPQRTRCVSSVVVVVGMWMVGTVVVRM